MSFESAGEEERLSGGALAHLSDDELLGQLDSLVASERQQLARLLGFLAELEERRLHLARGYSSLFELCTTALHFSEGEAFRRIAAARLARRFPAVLRALARGEIHLTGLVLLRDHLTESNHAELLAAARHKSKRDIQGLLAARFPRPDVPARIRRLPARQVPARKVPAYEGPPRAHGAREAANDVSVHEPPIIGAPGRDTVQEGPTETVSDVGVSENRRSSQDESTAPAVPRAVTPPPEHDAALRAPVSLPNARRELSGRVEPLSPARYRLELTATQSFKDKLDRARELLAHACPAGDLPTILERALDLLLHDLERSRRAKATRTVATPAKKSRPRASAPRESPAAPPLPSAAAHPSAPRGADPSRTVPREQQSPQAPLDSCEPPRVDARRSAIPRAVRRTVFERDGDRCSFVGQGGRRCSSRAFLELDHVHPHALGGVHSPENLRVLCQAHNRLLAERTFGREHVELYLRQRKSTGGGADAPALLPARGEAEKPGTEQPTSARRPAPARPATANDNRSVEHPRMGRA